jgi:hypothetical protein
MPKLEATLRLSQPLIPGQDVHAVLELRANQPVQVEWVDITFEGDAGWHTGSGKHRRSRREAVLRKATRLPLNTTLSGESSYNVRFPLPSNLPPSFTHASAYVSYAIRATASIPWAFDPHWNWPLRVDGRGIETRPRPLVLRRTDGVELSLERDALGRGDVVRGRIAWPLPNAPSEVQIVFREVVGLITHGGSLSERMGRAFGIPVAIDPHASEGNAFEFRLPEDLVVAFQSPAVNMRWELCVQRVQTGILWDSRSDELKTNITILASPSAQGTIEAAPPVGDARLLAVVREVAGTLRWNASEEGLSREVALRGESFSAHAMWQRRTHMMLTAEVSFPNLELGLRVSQSSLVQRMMQGDIQVGERAWDATHWVEGREAEQVRAFLAPIVQFAQQNQLDLVHADDDSLTFERIDTQVSASSLQLFVSQLDRLLAMLPLAMSQVPTSPQLSIDLPRALHMAEVLNGVFMPGAAGFHGTLPSGQAIASRVVFGASGMARTLEVRVAGLAEGTLDVGVGREAQSLSGPLRALVETLDEDVQIELHHGIGKATVLLTGTTPEVSPERVLQLGQWLVQASRAMSESGAFR